MLLGHLHSLPGGLFHLLSDSPCNPHLVALVSFAHRPRAAGGTFYDYTSRYRAVREEDCSVGKVCSENTTFWTLSQKVERSFLSIGFAFDCFIKWQDASFSQKILGAPGWIPVILLHLVLPPRRIQSKR
ncbi:hypothetical protein C8R48DRAFT_717808 [Suillus tomentosus]|nr:hypothetical protein C8R48DRAFT_717808 [Suillus tomentosus]